MEFVLIDILSAYKNPSLLAENCTSINCFFLRTQCCLTQAPPAIQEVYQGCHASYPGTKFWGFWTRSSSLKMTIVQKVALPSVAETRLWNAVEAQSVPLCRHKPNICLILTLQINTQSLKNRSLPFLFFRKFSFGGIGYRQEVNLPPLFCSGLYLHTNLEWVASTLAF